MKLFVTGMFRSGTTLLSRLLHSHPEIILANDAYLPFFSSFKMELANSLHVDIEKEYPAIDKYFYPVNDYYFSTKELNLFNLILKSNFNYIIDNNELEFLKKMMYEYGIDYSPKIAKRINEIKGDTYADVFISMLSLIEKSYYKENAKIIGFKEVWADEFVPALISTFPDIKIIQILRDPRSISASKNYTHKPYPWVFLARRWRKHALLFWLYSKTYTQNVLCIKYEELVTNPLDTSKKVCDFLNIQWDERIVNPKNYINGFGKPWVQNSSFKEKNNIITDTSLSRWRSVLKENEVKFIEYTCLPEMILTGYQVTSKIDIKEFEELLISPPLIPKEILSEWIKKYEPTSLSSTVIDLSKEWLRLNLLFSPENNNYELVQECFLSSNLYKEWKKQIPNFIY